MERTDYGDKPLTYAEEQDLPLDQYTIYAQLETARLQLQTTQTKWKWIYQMFQDLPNFLFLSGLVCAIAYTIVVGKI